MTGHKICDRWSCSIANQLVMHILIDRLRKIVEKAGILEPGQSGGRQGRKKERIFRRN
jgi:hypothetical protein